MLLCWGSFASHLQQTVTEVSCWSRQCRLDAAVLRHTSRQYNTTPPPYWRRSCWPSKPSSSPLSWNLLWSPEAKLATQEAPASPPVEAQLTGAQLVQKREIIRESSRRSKSSAGWRRKKGQLQHSWSLFKNLLICSCQPTPDLVEDMIANCVYCTWWQFNTFYSLNPNAKLFLWSCLTLGVQRVVLPLHSFSPFSEQV